MIKVDQVEGKSPSWKLGTRSQIGLGSTFSGLGQRGLGSSFSGPDEVGEGSVVCSPD